MPLREIKRLKALDRFLTIRFEKEKEVRDLVRLAAEICEAKIASISILDTVTHHFRYNWGIEMEDSKWNDSFCNLATGGFEPVIVTDVHLRPELANHPNVKGHPYIRFYAGIPLLTHDGHHVGNLCVLNDVCLKLTDTQLSMLGILAKQIVRLFELEASIMLLKEQLKDVRLSQIQLKSFFNSTLILHLLLDTDFRILSFNKIFSDLIFDNSGVVPKEGDDIRLYAQEHNLPEFIEHYNRAINGERCVLQMDSLNEHVPLNWLVHFEPALDPDDRIMGVSCNALDVTQKIEQEAQLTLQNEHLKKVAFYQSHDLRRPVSSILGIVDYLNEKLVEQFPEELEMLKICTRELDEKIKKIVNITDLTKD